MDRKGTNELISGEKPFFAIFSNLSVLFRRSFTRLKTARIDDVRRWTEGGLKAARRIALDRL